MRWKWFDSECTRIVTAEGTMTLGGLFIPLFLEQLLMNMTGTVNTLMLGHYADDAVAAVGAANQVIGFLYTFFAVFSGGASVVISHKLGAGKEKDASDAAFTSIIFGGLISLVMGIGFAGAALPVMSLMQLQNRVLTMAAAYFRICIGFAFIQGIMSAISAVLRSYGKAKYAVMISLLMNILNAVLNYIVIFRPIRPQWQGVTGIAVANVISHIFALGVGIFFLLKSGLQLNFKNKNIKTLACVGSILKIGVPGGVGSLSYSLSQVVSTSILAILGTTALTAKIYVSSIVFYVYVVGMALGLSTALMMGWMTGAGEYEKAYRLNQQILKLAVSLNVGLSVVIFFLHRPLMRLFTESEDIIAMTGIIFFIDIFVEFGRAFNHVEDNSLRGAGDVLFPMVIALISCWAVSILFAYILGIKLGLGLAGCWFAFMLDEMFRGGIFFWRFRSRKWMEKRI